MNTLNLPKKVYFKNGCLPVALRELSEVYHWKRVLLVTTPALYHNGTLRQVEALLTGKGIRTAEFFTIGSPASLSQLRGALPKLQEFQPEVILGLGGGSAMSAAKVLWCLFHEPALDLTADPVIPEGGRAHLVLAAASFGTGAQNSPFALFLDGGGRPVVLNSFRLLPILSVTDSQLCETLTPEQVRACGLATLTRALLAYTDEGCCEFTQGLLREAVRLVLENLPKPVHPAMLEKLSTAGSVAGAAYGNVLSGWAPQVSLEDIPAEHPRLAQLAGELFYPDAAALLAACKAL